MTASFALTMVAGLQLAFIILTVVLLFVTRMRGSTDTARSIAARAALAPSLQKIMLGEDSGESLAAALARLKPDVATRELITMGGSRLSLEQSAKLAALVRRAPWVERTLKQVSSSRWWKRMEAARLVAVVNLPGDEKLVARLVTDPHPAVASAATAAISARADAALVETIVRRLPLQPRAIRQQHAKALRIHDKIASRVVANALTKTATPQELRTWIQLAETLGTPTALGAAIPFASHPDPGVRTSVARALRCGYSRESVQAVMELLRDEDWRVRAAAARGVGSLNAREAIPLLLDAMRDGSWWVRFRAALALADLDDEGFDALDSARYSLDPYTRDMAIMVCNLSDGSRLELTSS